MEVLEFNLKNKVHTERNEWMRGKGTTLSYGVIPSNKSRKHEGNFKK